MVKMSDQTRLLRILLVEDDDDHAMIITRTLGKCAIENVVERVKDGVEAMDYLYKRGSYSTRLCPDFILLDFKMPRKSGLEALSEIKADPRLRLIPVIMLSTSDAESDRQKAYESYVNSYLVKPLSPDSFRAMIEGLNHYWGIINRPASVSLETNTVNVKLDESPLNDFGEGFGVGSIKDGGAFA